MIFGEGPIIKNIAGDLNKLFLQGTRAGQPINNVEGDAAADQATTQLMADRDPVIRDISTGLGWAGREVTVSGTGALQLVNSLGRPLKSWSVELAPYQEGSGDPSPENVRRIYGTNNITLWTSGINLLNIVPQSGSVSGIDYSVDNDGYITLNGTSVSSVNIYLANNIQPLPIQITLSSNVPILAGIYTGLVDQYSNTGILELRPGYTTITSVITGVPIESGYRIYIPSGFTYNNFKFRIMLNVGATALPYQPYAGTTKTDITFPFTIYNGIVGSDGGESRFGEVDMGTLDWNPSSPDRNIFRSDALQGIIVPSSSATIPTDAICEQFTAMGWVPISQSNNTKFAVADINSTSAGRVAFIDHRYTTASDFISAVAGVKLVFPLLTPQPLTISIPSVSTIDGNGTIWVTAEDGMVTSFSATYLQGE